MAGGALAGAGLLGTQDSGPGLTSPLADLGNPFEGWGWGDDSESMSGGAASNTRDFFANMSADDEAQYAKVRQILDDDQLRHLRTIFDRQDEGLCPCSARVQRARLPCPPRARQKELFWFGSCDTQTLSCARTRG
ncbi:MAG: hypothetical protein ACPIOQ_83375 [Promethearchaeia archaeon]